MTVENFELQSAGPQVISFVSQPTSMTVQSVGIPVHDTRDPVYITNSYRAPWFFAYVGFCLGMCAMASLVIAPFDYFASIFILIVTLLTALVVVLVLPGKISVFHDRLEIKVGLFFKSRTYFHELLSVEELSPCQPAFCAIKLALTIHNRVLIRRKSCFNVVFTPDNKDDFLNNLRSAIGSFHQPQNPLFLA